MTARIPIGACVREKSSGKLGRTDRERGGSARGHLFVQFDGERDRRTVRIEDVDYVAKEYNTAVMWENGVKYVKA